MAERNRRVPIVCAAVLLAGVAACGPDEGPDSASRRFASTVCTALDECDCVQRFSSQPACEDELVERFEGVIDDGLRLENDCFDQVLDAVETCASLDEIIALSACATLTGDKKHGESCSPHSDLGIAVNECEPGLVCAGLTCISDDESAVPVPMKAEGTPCLYDRPAPCGTGSIYCGFDERCHAMSLPDQPCDHPLGCELLVDDVGYYCKGVGVPGEIGTCARRPSVGEACDPRDYFVCGTGSCDPDSGLCVEQNVSAGVCVASDFPATWPTG